MKRTGLLLFAFAAMIIAFSGCSKDDDDDFSIVGTWQQESFSLTVDFGIPGMDPMVMEETDEDVTITFNADGTGMASDEDGSDPFTWSLSGNQLTINDEDMSLTLTLTTMTNSRVVGEQSLTAEEMAEMFELDDEGDFDMFPNLTATMKIVLVK